MVDISEEKSWTDVNTSLNIITDDTDSNLILIIRATPYLSKGALETTANISANDHLVNDSLNSRFQEKHNNFMRFWIKMQYITFDLPGNLVLGYEK